MHLKLWGSGLGWKANRESLQLVFTERKNRTEREKERQTERGSKDTSDFIEISLRSLSSEMNRYKNC